MVAGRVVWRHTGEGVAGVLVSNGREIVETGPDGSYTLPAPPRGEFVFITTPHGASCEQFYRHAGSGGSGTTSGSEGADGGVVVDVTGAVDFFLDPLPPADPRASTERVSFIQITDLHLTRWANAEELAADLALVAKAHPASEVGFLVATGDLTDSGAVEEFEAYRKAIQASPYPVVHLPGNHDYWNPSRDGNYRRYLGPPYYSFEAGPVHFICYDTPGSTSFALTWPGSGSWRICGECPKAGPW